MLKVKHIVKESKRQVFIKYYQHGLYLWFGTFEIQIIERVIARLHVVLQMKWHTHMSYILVLSLEACNAWNVFINYDYKARRRNEDISMKYGIHC